MSVFAFSAPFKSSIISIFATDIGSKLDILNTEYLPPTFLGKGSTFNPSFKDVS